MIFRIYIKTVFPHFSVNRPPPAPMAATSLKAPAPSSFGIQGGNYNPKIRGWSGGGGGGHSGIGPVSPVGAGAASSLPTFAPEPSAAEPAAAPMSYNEAEGFSDL